MATDDNIWNMDSAEVDAAKELRFATEDLLELLKPYAALALFNDQLKEALSECKRTLKNAKGMPWA